MDHKDLCEHTRIRLIAAAVGHQQCTKTEANIIQLPGTDRVIAIGTPAQVRALLVDSPTIPAQVPAAEVRAEDLKAIEDAVDVLDAFGNLPDRMMHPGPWNSRKAEDKIKAAREAISNLRSLAHQSTADKASEVRAAEWISVEDERKPEAGKPVLMFVRTLTCGEDDDGRPYETEGTEVAMGEYRKSHGYDVHYFDCYTSPMSDNDCITHWMPLPAAPSTADSANTGALGEKGAE